MITLWSHSIWSVNSVVSPLINVTVSSFFDPHYASFLLVKQNNEREQFKLCRHLFALVNSWQNMTAQSSTVKMIRNYQGSTINCVHFRSFLCTPESNI